MRQTLPESRIGGQSGGPWHEMDPQVRPMPRETGAARRGVLSAPWLLGPGFAETLGCPFNGRSGEYFSCSALAHGRSTLSFRRNGTFSSRGSALRRAGTGIPYFMPWEETFPVEQRTHHVKANYHELILSSARPDTLISYHQMAKWKTPSSR
jgi:hypothetical protein